MWQPCVHSAAGWMDSARRRTARRMSSRIALLPGPISNQYRRNLRAVASSVARLRVRVVNRVPGPRCSSSKSTADFTKPGWSKVTNVAALLTSASSPPVSFQNCPTIPNVRIASDSRHSTTKRPAAIASRTGGAASRRPERSDPRLKTRAGRDRMPISTLVTRRSSKRRSSRTFHTTLGDTAMSIAVALPDVAPGTNSDAVRIDGSYEVGRSSNDRMDCRVTR